MEDRKNNARRVPCPICGRKTQIRVHPDTVLVNFPLYCKNCKTATRINLVQFKMILSKEPDA